MSHPTLIQTSFNAGELSPEVYGRVDIAKYANGLKTLLNFICLLHGPVMRRSGMEFIATPKNVYRKLKLIPFEFSTTQAYMLEFGHLMIRFFKDGGQILHTATITGATQASPCVITCSAGHRFVDGQKVTITGVVGMTELNGNSYTVDDPAGGPPTTTFELEGINSTGYGAYVSDGEAQGIYEIESPYEAALTGDVEVLEIDTAQSADTLYIAHGNREPMTLTRSDHDDWTLEEIDFLDGPYDQESGVDYASGLTLTPSAQTGTITITASAAIFAATDLGRLIGMTDPGSEDWGVAKVTVFTDTTHVTALVVIALGGTGAAVDFKFGAWSDDRGWPRTVTFDKDRLVWGGSANHPRGIWGSKVGIYTDNGISSPVVDDDALSLVLGAKKINAIRWIESTRRLIVGTTSAEWFLSSASGEGAITPTSKQATPSSHNGSSTVQPVVVGNTILYVQLHGRIVEELKYSNADDAYGGEELTVLAEHLTRSSGIIDMAYQKMPYRIVWCVREDGVLLGMTYYPGHQVVGWHRHVTDGNIEGVAVIPGSGEDEIWLVVQRDIENVFVRRIERFSTSFKGLDSTEAFYVDSGLTYDGRIDIDSISRGPDIVTATDHGFENGDVVRFRVEDDPDDTDDLPSLNLEELIVSDKATNTFRCKDSDGNYIDFAGYKITDTNGTRTVAKNVTVISGLDHLEDETVSILTDGGPVPDKTVSSGAITLDTGASVIHVGMPFVSDLETLNPEIQLRDSPTAQGALKRTTSVTLRLNDSIGGKMGPDKDNLTDLDFVDDTVPLGQPPPLFSGDTDEESFDGPYDKNVHVFIRQSQPLPFTLLAIIANTEFDEGDQ